MNREIKFRMWRDSRMQGVHTMYSNHPEPPCDPQNFAFSKEEILMQFTGLKDKNGKEIYEGDVIEWEKENKSICRSKVFYDDKLFCPMVLESIIGFEKQFFTNASAYHAAKAGWLIIGNIYENPDMIKAK